MWPRRLRQWLAASPRGATAIFPSGIPISYPRTSLRSHSGSVPKISFSPKPPENTKQKKKKKTLTQPNQTVRAPPASSEADSNPSLSSTSPASSSWAIGDSSWEPWGSLRRGHCNPPSPCSCPADQDRPAGARLLVHPWGVGVVGCGRSHVATTWPVIG